MNWPGARRLFFQSSIDVWPQSKRETSIKVFTRSLFNYFPWKTRLHHPCLYLWLVCLRLYSFIGVNFPDVVSLAFHGDNLFLVGVYYTKMYSLYYVNIPRSKNNFLLQNFWPHFYLLDFYNLSHSLVILWTGICYFCTLYACFPPQPLLKVNP